MPVDPRTLGLLRIGLAGLLLIDLALCAGRFSAAVAHADAPLSLSRFAGQQSEWLICCALIALPYAALGLGHRTRLAQLLSLAGFIVLHPAPNEPGTLALCSVLWWTTFLPMGRRFSLDAVRRSLATPDHSPESIRALVHQPRDTTPIRSLAVWAMSLQLLWLCAGPQPGWIRCVGLSLVALALLLGRRRAGAATRGLRGIAMACVVAFAVHAWLVGHDGVFGAVLLILASWLLSDADWSSLESRARLRRKRIVYYDGGCGICFQLARICARLDLFQRLEMRASLEAAQSDLPEGLPLASLDDTLLVMDVEAGTGRVRGEAWGEVFHSLPAGALIAWIFKAPILKHVGNLFYDEFAPRRARISTFFGYAGCGLQPIAAPAASSLSMPDQDAPQSEMAMWRGRIAQGIREAAVAGLLGVSFLQVAGSDRIAPRVIEEVGAYTRIDQAGIHPSLRALRPRRSP